MDELTKFIHKTHYRTFAKVWPLVHEQFPDKTPQDVKNVLATFITDPKNLKQQKKFYNKIFSDHPHAWVMDILDNSGQTPDYNNKEQVEAVESNKQHPKYWLIFININTRFAAAYPIDKRETADILNVLRQFIREHKCTSLTSDKESAFIADETAAFLKQNNISQFIVLDNNHTSLAIIDTFIRHLRDRNTTNEKSKYQSHHSKYRNFSTHRMSSLIDTYNNTVHTSTHMKPIDMENDIKAERQYIAYHLIRRSKAADHSIPVGHFVRVVLSKDVMKKRRFKVSRECYTITGRDGKNYLVSAADGTATTLPRHRLIDLGANKPDKYKLADTLPEGSFIPVAILGRSNQRGAGLVVRYANNETGNARLVDLRRHHPQVKSNLEKNYEAQLNQRRRALARLLPR